MTDILLVRRWSNGPYESALASCFDRVDIPIDWMQYNETREKLVKPFWDWKRAPKPANVSFSPLESICEHSKTGSVAHGGRYAMCGDRSCRGSLHADYAPVAIALDEPSADYCLQRGYKTILNATWDAHPGYKREPENWDRLAHYVFLNKEVRARYPVRGDRTSVIELGVQDKFAPWQPKIPRALSLGSCLKTRPEKNWDFLCSVRELYPVNVFGPGNLSFLPEHELVSAFSQHAAYLNPSPVFGIALAEAMMAGMPVVSVQVQNLQDVLQHGENCLIVNDPEQAAKALSSFEAHPNLAQCFGMRARETALVRFGIERFRQAWRDVAERVRI